MTAIPAVAPHLGPLDAERGELLRRVVDGLEPAALHWLSGFAAGIAYARAPGSAASEVPVLPTSLAASAVAAQVEPAARLAVVYGSQTGNGRRIAERLGRAAEAAGLAVRVYAARDYPLRDLAQERLLTVVMSTHGDGDPPDDARVSSSTSPADARPSSRSSSTRCSRSATRATRSSARWDGRWTSGSRRSVRSVCSPAWTATWTSSRSPRRGRNAW